MFRNAIKTDMSFAFASTLIDELPQKVRGKMKYALVLFLAATTASIGCGGGTTISSPSSTQPPVVQAPPNTPPTPPPSAPPPPATPAKHYQIVDLAPLPGDAAAQANAISNGHAVGYSIANGVTHATLWENGSVEDLGAGDANAINNADQISGFVPQSDGTFHATLWDHRVGVVTDLGLLTGFDSSIATGINDSGEIVGIAFVLQNPSNQVGFLWTQQTGMQAIPGSATAGGISGENIAGMTQNLQAAIFTATGTTIALGTLGDFSIAISVNSKRNAVGYSPLVPSGPVHAFFYNGTNGTIQDLGTIQTGSSMVATSLNDSDLVVGVSDLNGNGLPWIWSASTGIEDLNTLVDPGWQLTGARGIDSAGEITGAGVLNGMVHGFLLTPD